MAQNAGHPAKANFWAYAQLVRAPNVFTALADVLAGYLIVRGMAADWLVLLFLGISSASLYSAGMVLNDVYDVEVDTRQRPHRPIPSGQVAVARAWFFGVFLLVFGVAAAWCAAAASGQWRTGAIALGLAVAVWLYDAVVKETPLAPVMMGACRGLNLLLGMSVVDGELAAIHYALAGGLFAYIVGVTWFARTEATVSDRLQLVMATATMAAGIGVLAAIPVWLEMSEGVALGLYLVREGVVLLFAVVGVLILWRAVWAVADPVPARVQAAVKHCILSLIVLDGAMAAAFRGPAAAVCVLVLLLPTMWLGRWFAST